MYTLEEHRLRFAAWTCARAALRGVKEGTWANVYSLLGRITSLAELKESRFGNDREFDDWHSRAVTEVIREGKKLDLDLTYGLAAKVIAIYIKTLYVIPGERKDVLKHAHPPIDRILLSNMLPTRSRDQGHNLSWSKFDQKRYRHVMSLVRETLRREKGLWMAEQYWQPK